MVDAFDRAIGHHAQEILARRVVDHGRRPGGDVTFCLARVSNSEELDQRHLALLSVQMLV
jgi:hypothetical protein